MVGKVYLLPYLFLLSERFINSKKIMFYIFINGNGNRTQRNSGY